MEFQEPNTHCLNSKILELAIGTGSKNTKRFFDQTGGNVDNKAISASIAYANATGFGWYLPSTDELNQLCQYARGAPRGASRCSGGTTAAAVSKGYRESWYKTSSESNATQHIIQDFRDGTQLNFGKAVEFPMRPIRAF